MTRAVLLDSGGVLIRPVNGRWMPSPALEQALADRGHPCEADQLDAAHTEAYRYLDEVHGDPITEEHEELAVMTRYYELLLAELGLAEARELARDLAGRGRDHIEPYDWTEPVLRELHARGITTVIVSDSWPSLRAYYRNRGLDRFIAGFAISAELGVTKPHEAMYLRGLELAGCDPADAVFVDDWEDCVLGATRLGIPAYRLAHDDAPASTQVTDLRNLTELLALL
jgi:putative hydrolase of the HAD superfamily